MTPAEAKQAEYEKRQRIRRGYIDNRVRQRFDAEVKLRDKGEGYHYVWKVAWCPPMHLRAIGSWMTCDKNVTMSEPDLVATMEYRLERAGPCWYVTCEGYLVDKWWGGYDRDLSDMGY